jgi:hypothetical protein
MPPDQRPGDPKGPDWVNRIVIALLVAWLVVSCESNASFEPRGDYHESDCSLIGPGLEVGSDC